MIRRRVPRTQGHPTHPAPCRFRIPYSYAAASCAAPAFAHRRCPIVENGSEALKVAYLSKHQQLDGYYQAQQLAYSVDYLSNVAVAYLSKRPCQLGVAIAYCSKSSPRLLVPSAADYKH